MLIYIYTRIIYFMPKDIYRVGRNINRQRPFLLKTFFFVGPTHGQFEPNAKMLQKTPTGRAGHNINTFWGGHIVARPMGGIYIVAPPDSSGGCM